MRGRTVVVAVTAASLAVTALSTVSAVAANKHPRAVSTHAAVSRNIFDPAGINGVRQSELLQVSQRISAGVSPKVLAGVTLNTHAGMVNVYLANTSAARRAAVMAALPASQRNLVRLHQVPRSAAALNAAVSRAGRVADRLVASKLPVQSYWSDFTRGVVKVELYRPTAAQRQAAARALAGLPVRVTTTSTKIGVVPPVIVRAGSAAAAVQAAAVGKNRAFDRRPFAGGDFIASNLGGGRFSFCTDSWPIKIGGKPQITTAGHCGKNGHRWIDMTLNNNLRPLGNRKLIGVARRNKLHTKKHVDSMVLPTSNVASVWQGHVLKNHLAAVRKHVAPRVGMRVCNDGAYEGTTCGARIVKGHFNSCIFVKGEGKFCHLYQARKPRRKVLLGQGDSGGPVEIVIMRGGKVRAVKAVGLNSLETIANLKCPHFTWRGRVCSNVAFFTSINSILKVYHARLRTRK